ncbi:MAG: Holliday junction branch migration protein RuvA [Firmicutes bacterium]|nr:Holliday junction branch migration protein RuvA [Bacillota bacterium]
MIVSLKGRLEDITDTSLVVDIHGIGYEVNVTSAVLANLPPLGQEIHLYSYLQVREDALVLYGFSSSEERDLFQQIIGVAGIGPKTGIAILSNIGPLEFMRAVENQQLEVLVRLPGIGKKTGERILLELKGKFRNQLLASKRTLGAAVETGGVFQDALEALKVLGYSAGEAERMVEAARSNLAGDYDLQELLKVALANSSKQKGQGTVK